MWCNGETVFLFWLAFEKWETTAIGNGTQSKLEEWEEWEERDGVW